MSVEIHSHGRTKSLMGLSSGTSLLSLPFFGLPLTSAKYKTSPYGSSKLILALTVLIAITSLCECTTEQDQLATQQDRLNVLGQRLVRRNFLRFGKRSGGGAILHDDDENYYFPDTKLNKREDAPPPTGPGELYEAMLMGKQPHSTSARSFLRFGKRDPYPTQSMISSQQAALAAAAKRRADNFLRFGKSMGMEEDQRVENLLGRWKKFLLEFLIF